MQKNTKAKTMLPAVDADKNGGVPISEGEVREFVLQDNLQRSEWDVLKMLGGWFDDLIAEAVTKYVKSFYSVMCAPSCVKISMLHGGTKDTAQHWRIHHRVQWENCAPKIISAQWRKTKGRR